MDKQEMIQMKLKGYSYAQIGERAGVSRQRIHQIISPPKAVRQYVIKKYKGQCVSCGILVGQRGHVHHEGANGEEDYNDIDNLQLLCVTCHLLRHRPEVVYDGNCPECGSAKIGNNRYLWHKVEGKRVQVMQMRCHNCGRLFIPQID